MFMSKNEPVSSPEALLQQIDTDRPLPPLEQWNPDFCGDIPMRITRDGRWFYQGGEIRRPAMVKMFSRILWKEGDRYFLKTPVEKVGIEVEDVPFQVISVERTGASPECLSFTTSTGEQVVAGKVHPIRVELDPLTGEPSPYLLIRYGMEGRLQRNVFYQLAEWAESHRINGRQVWTVSSEGVQFNLGEG
ncbi:Proteophosphoglycan precursor protein [Nitrincola lacisaponensis]|uniref:Proteophosphoglycan protein n=2 Tax=Nitrincola lacisaponensis TaxID=267850 RepID=A0A063Y1W9_9GAMM|nr:Proteophosphoglycan precursor protein [Nitrincola lacisaponensis]